MHALEGTICRDSRRIFRIIPFHKRPPFINTPFLKCLHLNTHARVNVPLPFQYFSNLNVIVVYAGFNVMIYGHLNINVLRFVTNASHACHTYTRTHARTHARTDAHARRQTDRQTHAHQCVLSEIKKCATCPTNQHCFHVSSSFE